jgi:hypothetical protein
MGGAQGLGDSVAVYEPVAFPMAYTIALFVRVLVCYV